MTVKALSLLSGGLDSLLATKLVLDQGIQVIGLHFTSLLCNALAADKGLMVQEAARELGIRLIVRDKGPEFLQLVRKPSHGYGKRLNPCIDCKIYMLRAASEVMDAEGADFVITGEVLGQRPMSQMRQTITRIEKESGLEGKIVRPLSAKLFPPSTPEAEGAVNREKLLAISGRSRREQYRLAGAHDLKTFGAPAGGCLLTDPIYAGKLKDLLAQNEPFSMHDVALLRMGRHFRINGLKLVLGRNKAENEWLAASWTPSYRLVYPVTFKGPTGIVKGSVDRAITGIAAGLIAFYGKQASPEVVLEFFDGRPSREKVQRVDVDPQLYGIDTFRKP
jgi:tRNA U34 2-thiouridine synthase MnmA/TrmU